MLFSKLIFSIAYYKRHRIAKKADSARRREEKAKMNGQVIRKKVEYSENLPDEVIEVQPSAEENTKDNDDDIQGNYNISIYNKFYY